MLIKLPGIARAVFGCVLVLVLASLRQDREAVAVKMG